MENIGIDLKGLKVYDFDQIKERLFLKLLNEEVHREIVEKGPSVRIVDLVAVYGLLLNSDEEGCMTMHVNHQMLERWGIEEAKLFEWALENTRKLFGVKMVPLSKVIKGYLNADDVKGIQSEGLNDEMYVITNKDGSYGASMILMPNVLNALAEKIGKDLILIPSSVHEMMAFGADDKYSVKLLNELIREVNKTLNPLEVLAEHAYFYSRKADKLSIAKEIF